MNMIGAVSAPDQPVDDDSILIELDLTTEWTPPLATTPAPRQGLWLTVLLAPLLVLSLVAGGERARTLDPVFTLGMGTLQRELIGDVLYVTPRSADELRAYDVRQKRLMWSRPTTDSDLQWVRHGQVIAISKSAGPGKLPAVEILEGATGRVLWRRASAVVVGGDSTTVVLRQFSQATAGTQGRQLRTSPRTSSRTSAVVSGETPRAFVAEQTALIGVNARTGMTVWSRGVPLTAATFTLAESSRSLATGDRGVLVVDSGGTVRAIDLATGKVLATPGADEWQLHSGGTTTQPLISCLVYLSGLQAGTMDSRAVCLPEAIRGVAAGATGSARNWAAGDGSETLSVKVKDDGTILLVEAASGTVVRTLRGWAGAGVINEGLDLIIAQTGQEAKPNPVLAAVDTTTGRLRVLARIPDGMSAPTCRETGEYLMCYAGSTLGVWRMDRSTLR